MNYRCRVSDQALREDIGSLLWIGFEGPTLDEQTKQTLGRGDAGGVTLFRRNLVQDENGRTDTRALTALNKEIHSVRPRLLISVDQEGGRVQRVKEPPFPPAMSLAKLERSAACAMAKERGHEMGTQLRGWGFDISFAPVLDVHTNPQNPIIGDRAFGTDAGEAAVRALAYAEGLASAGILGCGKHFPGHGDTSTDSHLELPTLPHDMERLRRVELLPFAEAVKARLPMFMTAHVVFEALDPGVPATLSRRVVQGLLREEMGYEGVVVSDDLDMKAIADNVGVEVAAVQAIEAGCDALLLCRDLGHQEAARTALHTKASHSSLFRERVGQAAQRVANLCRS